MRIVVDSREQEPFTFSVPSVRRKLEVGDYSVEGFENRMAVERKSLADYVRTVIREKSRFHRELVKLAVFEAACVVVEAPYRDIVEGRYRSDVHPAALMGSTASIIHDYGIPVFFCGDRQSACVFTENYLSYFFRRHNDVVQ